MSDPVLAVMVFCLALIFGILVAVVITCVGRTGDPIRPVSARQAQELLNGLVRLTRAGAMTAAQARVQYSHEVGALRASFLYPRGYNEALEWAYISFLKEEWDKGHPGERTINPWRMPPL